MNQALTQAYLRPGASPAARFARTCARKPFLRSALALHFRSLTWRHSRNPPPPGTTLPVPHEGRAAFIVRGGGPGGAPAPYKRGRAPGGDQPAVIATVRGPSGAPLWEHTVGAWPYGLT